jgi:hypothetical protein
MNQLWTALVGVVPTESSSVLAGGKGAYVNAVALAENAREFCDSVKQSLLEMNLECIEFEDLQTMEDRNANFVLPQAIASLAKQALKTKTVAFSEFFVFEQFDE